MAASTLSQTVTLTPIDCGSCGGIYAINERYRGYRQENGGFWNCPYCQSSWGFRKDGTELERAKRELEAERQRRTAALARANEADEARRHAEAELQRHKTRTQNGVCPCCKRTFKQLAAHMKTKHPHYPTTPLPTGG